MVAVSPISRCHVGYQDHSAFTRMFKATVGVTPSEYREVLLRRQTRAH